MTFHPRLPNPYSTKIYREGPAPIGSGGPRRLHLASPLASSPEEPGTSFQIPETDHIRTMALAENKPPPNWNGRTPYFYTRYSDNPIYRPLAETDNIGRFTNPRRRTGPRLRFQFARREPQPPPRPVRRPEPPVVQILEEGGRGAEHDGARRELDAVDEIEEGMDMFHLHSTSLF